VRLLKTQLVALEKPVKNSQIPQLLVIMKKHRRQPVLKFVAELADFVKHIIAEDFQCSSRVGIDFGRDLSFEMAQLGTREKLFSLLACGTLSPQTAGPLVEIFWHF